MTDTTHPKHIEAQAFAAERHRKRANMKHLLAEATKGGVRFLEIAPLNYRAGMPGVLAREGRMTIAYVVHRRNVVLVATSICHPDDDFDKVQGRFQAAANLSEQRAVLIRVPVRKGSSIKQALADMFTHHTY